MRIVDIQTNQFTFWSNCLYRDFYIQWVWPSKCIFFAFNSSLDIRKWKPDFIFWLKNQNKSTINHSRKMQRTKTLINAKQPSKSTKFGDDVLVNMPFELRIGLNSCHKLATNIQWKFKIRWIRFARLWNSIEFIWFLVVFFLIQRSTRAAADFFAHLRYFLK